MRTDDGGYTFFVDEDRLLETFDERSKGERLWCSHIKELLNKINSIRTTKDSHTLYNEVYRFVR